MHNLVSILSRDASLENTIHRVLLILLFLPLQTTLLPVFQPTQRVNNSPKKT